MKSIIVHGGCGDEKISEKKMNLMKQGVKQAAEIGMKKLNKGLSAVDTVEETIKYLENDPVFDAGTGSFYNLLGEIEMDASIMTGRGETGAVACIQGVQHPISVARKVMEELPHILLAGEGAKLFARSLGIPEYDPSHPDSKRFLQENIDNLSPDMENFRKKYQKIREEQNIFSTVGVVVLDKQGLLTAGTSTGGILQKLPGRIGDTPIIGAGTYAAPEGAVSATGMGEGIIKLSVSRQVVEFLKNGMKIQEACEKIIEEADKQKITCGVIALDDKGTPGIAYNGKHMTYYSLNN
ncbi:MAG: isoaspartyl peptidase/L-asparaginase family protein [bacterium]